MPIGSDGDDGQQSQDAAGAEQQPEGGAAAEPPPPPPAASDNESEDVDHDLEEEDLEEGWFGQGMEDDLDAIDEDEDEDDEDWEGDEEMEWWGDDAESQSEDEQPAEAEALQRLEAETAGRHVHSGGAYAAYNVPTIFHHFQSADALSLAEVPPSPALPHGALLAATFDSEGVAAWLLPPAGRVRSLGAGSEPGVVRLGGFQAPRDIFSMALSPDGRWIATGGEGGLLCLYEVALGAPPRPPPPLAKPQLAGVNYLYTPVISAADLNRVLVAHRQRQMAGGAPPGLPPLPPAIQGLSPRLLESLLSQTLALAMRADFGDMTLEASKQQMERVIAQAADGGGGGGPGAGGEHAAGLQRARQQLQNVTLRLQSQNLRNVAAAAAVGGGVGAVSAAAVAAGVSAVATACEAAVPHTADEAGARQFAQASEAAAAAAAKVEKLARQEVAVAAGEQEGKGKAPAAAPEEGAQQAQQAAVQQSQQGGQAAVMLRGIFSLGLEPAQAKHVPFLSDGMTNGVRWGLVAGRQRLLAADQSQYVYVFELPSAAAAEAASSSGGGGGAASGGRDLRPEGLLVPSLGPPSEHWRLRPVNFFKTEQHALGARVSQQHPPPPDAPAPAGSPPRRPPAPPEQQPVVRSQRAAAAAASAAWAPLTRPAPPAGQPYQTAALGPFPVPCNLAAASPDGRWVAVVGDSQALLLCDQAAGFAWRQLPYDVGGSREGVEQGLEAGGQYVAWNASSTLVALTSDALHSVFVFEPASGRLVMRVEGHRRPCLCVSFAPWDDRLLCYAEEHLQVHMRRVPAAAPTAAAAAPASAAGEDEESEGGQGGGGGGAPSIDQNARDDLADARPDVQLLRLPVVPSPTAAAPGAAAAAGLGMNGRRRRVTGLALTRQGDVLVTTARQGALLRYLSSAEWSPERHSTWPPAFRAAVQALLLCAHRQHATAGPSAAAGLWSLPLPLLQLIAGMAAGTRTDWLAVAAAPAAAEQAAAEAGQAVAAEAGQPAAAAEPGGAGGLIGGCRQS